MKKQKFARNFVFGVWAMAMTALPAAALEKEDYNFDTTAHLYNLCSVRADHGDAATAFYACNGFIEGAIQYHDGVSGVKGLHKLICYPKGTTLDEGKTVFVAWAESNKGDMALMSEQPVKGLVRALSEAYPCDK